MSPTSTLLFYLVLAMSAVATPIRISENRVNVPFALSVRDLPMTLPAMDRARAASLVGRVLPNSKRDSESSNVAITNTATVYSVKMAVGTPSTDYNIIVDTGSSNTWIGASTEYTPTSTSKKTNDTFVVQYGSGFVVGVQYKETVQFGDLVIKDQGIGVAKASGGLNGYDGILGIGPASLTGGSLKDEKKKIPTIVDNLFKQGKISKKSLGISFSPATAENANTTTGSMSFGGPDHTKYTGELNYVPITTTEPASHYWGVDQSITYGDKTIMNGASGITDTGTTLILIATDAFNAYQEATGAELDEKTGLLAITKEQYANLKDLVFHIGDHEYTLTANAQIWPRSLNSFMHGDEEKIYLIVADIGDQGGLDFINGFTFLERFYTVYDTSNQQIGFATTSETKATTN